MKIAVGAFLTAILASLGGIRPPRAMSSQEDEREQLRKSVVANIQALPKLWSDARFWIVTDGRKTGWVRYQASTQEYEGEKYVAIDYERTTYAAWSSRYRVYLRENEFASPRAKRYGQSWVLTRFEKGKIKTGPFPGLDDPGDLAPFPEILPAYLPFQNGLAMKFSTLSDDNHTVQRGGLVKYSGTEKVGQGDKGSAECHKFTVAFPTIPWNRPEVTSAEVWIRPDRTLAKARLSINYEPSEGTKATRIEELISIPTKEWDTATVELNEIRAAAHLKAIGTVLLRLRSHDIEENGKNDEWVGDVSGLYRLIPPKAKEHLQLIGREVAMADAAPLPEGPEKGGATLSQGLCAKPVPLFGYFFKVLRRMEESGRMRDLNNGTNRHEYNFAICAFPAEYGKTGRKTFLIEFSVVPYWKDLKGKPVDDCPESPSKDDWQTGFLKK